MSASRNCATCGKLFASNGPVKLECCGQPIRLAGTKPRGDRSNTWMSKAAQLITSVCGECPKFVETGGKAGCSEYPGSPCDSTKAIINGSGCHDHANYRFLPSPRRPLEFRKYHQPALDSHCVAVTSLADGPRAKHISKCLDSWVAFGLSIHGVQRSEEVAHLASLFPQVACWHTNDDVGDYYAKPTQPINVIASLSIELGQTILMINSDIEIYGDQASVVEPLEHGDQIVGIRWNYSPTKYERASRERHGMDVFSITPEYAAGLPMLPLSIGRPFFDYWLPHHSRVNNVPMRYIGDRLFYHQRHAQAWQNDDWARGRDVFCKHYGVDPHHMAYDFRNSLPYPPDPQ